MEERDRGCPIPDSVKVFLGITAIIHNNIIMFKELSPSPLGQRKERLQPNKGRPERARSLTAKALFDDLVIYPYFLTRLGSTPGNRVFRHIPNCAEQRDWTPDLLDTTQCRYREATACIDQRGSFISFIPLQVTSHNGNKHITRDIVYLYKVTCLINRRLNVITSNGYTFFL